MRRAHDREADAALQAAGLVHTATVYPGADHAFFNDTGTRYDPGAAAQAWRATLDWFGRNL
ncbi:MAG: dienelactone hydrolase family protein [Pseudonocardia sp.]